MNQQNSLKIKLTELLPTILEEPIEIIYSEDIRECLSELES